MNERFYNSGEATQWSDPDALAGLAVASGLTSLSDESVGHLCQDVTVQPRFEIGELSLATLPVKEWRDLGGVDLLLTLEAQTMTFDEFRVFYGSRGQLDQTEPLGNALGLGA